MPNLIPLMDDPLSAGWRQPENIRDAPMDDTHVILTKAQMKGLYRYDSTLPSGVYPGKCWLRTEVKPDGGAMVSRTLLAWFGPETADHKCPIMFREVLDLTISPPAAPPLDLAYSKINALGGTFALTDEVAQGYNEAIGDALKILTDMGAKDAPLAALLADAGVKEA